MARYSNILTEQLSSSSIMDFELDDPNAYTKLENSFNNNIRLFFRELKSFYELTEMLDWILIKDTINDPHRLKYMAQELENEYEKISFYQSISDFMPIIEEVYRDNIATFSTMNIAGKKFIDWYHNQAVKKIEEIYDNLFEIYAKIEKFLPEESIKYLTMFFMTNSLDLDYAPTAILNLINNNPLFGSPLLNFSKTNFANDFIKEVFNSLIESGDLDCLEEIMSNPRDIESRDIILEAMNEVKDKLYKKHPQVKKYNINKEQYEQIFELFFSSLFSDKNSDVLSKINVSISNHMGAMHEFYDKYYETFGNMLTLPLIDLLINSIVLSDKTLLSFCQYNELNFSSFLIDINKKLDSNDYLNLNYTEALEIDKQIKEK